eukprot:2744462-Prymnesium_polylepis.1
MARSLCGRSVWAASDGGASSPLACGTMLVASLRSCDLRRDGKTTSYTDALRPCAPRHRWYPRVGTHVLVWHVVIRGALRASERVEVGARWGGHAICTAWALRKCARGAHHRPQLSSRLLVRRAVCTPLTRALGAHSAVDARPPAEEVTRRRAQHRAVPYRRLRLAHRVHHAADARAQVLHLEATLGRMCPRIRGSDHLQEPRVGGRLWAHAMPLFSLTASLQFAPRLHLRDGSPYLQSSILRTPIPCLTSTLVFPPPSELHPGTPSHDMCRVDSPPGSWRGRRRAGGPA